LEKDPAFRYQTASDLKADLERLVRDTKSADLRRNAESASISSHRAQKSRKVLHSLAVMPFANVNSDPQMEYLSEGITDNLINNLSQLRKLRVVPRTLVFRFKGLDTDLTVIGRELDVDAVLTGRISQRGNTLLIGAELSDVPSVSQLWGAQYNRKFTDIFAVQEEIAQEVSEKLRLKLTGEERKRLAKRPTHSKEASEFYLKGLHFGHKLSPDNLKRAIEYGRLAIDKDPGFAEAYTLLAYCYSMLGAYQFLPPADAFPQAKAAALKARDLDETRAEPHVALAVVLLLYEWKWSEGEKEGRRALELNPNYSFAHQVYGVYLVAQGNLEEAIAAQERALDLDPLSPTTNLVLGAWLFLARHYRQAIEQLLKTLELEPNLVRARRFVVIAYAQLGKFDEAIAEHQRLPASFRDNPLGNAVLAYVYALASRRNEAQALLNEFKEPKGLDLETRYFMAAVCAALREIDEALELLNGICDDRYPLMNYVRVDPIFDPLRAEPRFHDLLERLDLPQ
jgi:TolB-like protein/Tfp pilus assembly protein PilF